MKRTGLRNAIFGSLVAGAMIVGDEEAIRPNLVQSNPSQTSGWAEPFSYKLGLSHLTSYSRLGEFARANLYVIEQIHTIPALENLEYGLEAESDFETFYLSVLKDFVDDSQREVYELGQDLIDHYGVGTLFLEGRLIDSYRREEIDLLGILRDHSPSSIEGSTIMQICLDSGLSSYEALVMSNPAIKVRGIEIPRVKDKHFQHLLEERSQQPDTIDHSSYLDEEGFDDSSAEASNSQKASFTRSVISFVEAASYLANGNGNAAIIIGAGHGPDFERIMNLDSLVVDSEIAGIDTTFHFKRLKEQVNLRVLRSQTAHLYKQFHQHLHNPSEIDLDYFDTDEELWE